MRIGILAGGGDAPGLTAAIRAVARRAFQLGHSASGVQNGWAGCLDSGVIEELRPADVRGILPLGGTILGTSRTNPLKMKDGVATVIRVLRRHGIDAMVAIGGDDTLSVASALHEAGFQTVGVPKKVELRGRRLRNRIVSTPHATGWGGSSGLRERSDVDYLVRKAAAGCGLVMTFGSASVDPTTAASHPGFRSS